MFENTLETFPWITSDNNIPSSINSDLNAILHQQWIKYCNSYYLINKDWNNHIRNFISSNNNKWLIYYRNIMNRIYNWDISYSQNIKDLISDKKLDNIFYIKLKDLFYFQMKKPWINELETENNYNSSARIFKQIFEESIDILENWDSIKIDFEYWDTSYSKLMKNMIFWKKMMFQNYLESEELFNSFTDKLEFVEFYIKISTNSSKVNEIKAITKKNIEVYKNKFNSYVISKTKWSFFKLKNKIQMDSLIWSHGLIVPIQNKYSLNNKSKIVSYWSDITNNNLLKDQNKNYEITLWKIYKNNVIENKDYLVIKDKLLKNLNSILIGQSWSWKSYSWASVIAWKTIKAVKDFNNNLNNKYWSRIIILDPHAAFWNNIVDIISEYQLKNNVQNFSKKIYSKFEDDWNNYRILSFNPLHIPNIGELLNDKQKFLDELNHNSNSVLDWIKWYFNEWDFWARNQNLMKKFIEIFIILNLIQYNKYKDLKNKSTLTDKEKDLLLKASKLYSIWDIINVLIDIVQDWEIKDEIYDWIKDLINSWNNILEELWEDFFKYIEYLKNIVKKDKTFIESTINKLWVFNWSLYRTFWWCSLINYTLDLKDLYLKNSKIVEFISFDLWDYSSSEKSIITNFLTSYSYNLWTKRDLNDEKLGEISIYIDEVNSVLSSNNSIEILKNLFFEIRKYHFSINLAYQSCKQKWFSDLYSNAWHIITFSNSKSEIEFLLWDFNSWTNVEIDPNDIVNLNRWSFYVLLKTNNKNITLYCDWLDFNNESDLKMIIS